MSGRPMTLTQGRGAVAVAASGVAADGIHDQAAARLAEFVFLAAAAMAIARTRFNEALRDFQRADANEFFLELTARAPASSRRPRG